MDSWGICILTLKVVKDHPCRTGCQRPEGEITGSTDMRTRKVESSSSRAAATTSSRGVNAKRVRRTWPRRLSVALICFGGYVLFAPSFDLVIWRGAKVPGPDPRGLLSIVMPSVAVAGLLISTLRLKNNTFVVKSTARLTLLLHVLLTLDLVLPR